MDTKTFLKTIRTTGGEETFRAIHNCTRANWIKDRMKEGMDPKKAEAESKRLIAAAVETRYREMMEAAKRYGV